MKKLKLMLGQSGIELFYSKVIILSSSILGLFFCTILINLADYISIITLIYRIFIFILLKERRINWYRKHAFIISAAITPSDLLSMSIAMIPLLILYEIYTTIRFNIVS